MHIITVSGIHFADVYSFYVCRLHGKMSLYTNMADRTIKQMGEGGGEGGIDRHEMYCHDLEVMSLSPNRAELGVRGSSVLSRTWTKHINLLPLHMTLYFVCSTPGGNTSAVSCFQCNWQGMECSPEYIKVLYMHGSFFPLSNVVMFIILYVIIIRILFTFLIFIRDVQKTTHHQKE